MADDEQGEDGECRSVLPGGGAIHEPEDGTPEQQHQERMGVGIADEGQRRESGITGIDAHLFETGGQEERPEKIGPLSGDEQHGERDARRGALGGEAKRKVADEHPGGMLTPSSQESRSVVSAASSAAGLIETGGSCLHAVAVAGFGRRVFVPELLEDRLSVGRLRLTDPRSRSGRVGVGRRWFVRCDFHISYSCRAKKRPSPVWVMAWFDFVCYLAWLHHPVTVGRLRPTLIRGRTSSSANDTTGDTIEHGGRPGLLPWTSELTTASLSECKKNPVSTSQAEIREFRRPLYGQRLRVSWDIEGGSLGLFRRT